MNVQRGVTLVELVIAIVVISVAVAGLMRAYSGMMTRSADPLVYQQSLAVAEAMLEEITAKAFLDPDTGTLCPGPEAGGRSDYDNVCDYNGFSMASITDLAGNPLNLSGYSVSVTVASAGGDMDLAANDGLRIDVTVSGPLNDVELTGYRARY